MGKNGPVRPYLVFLGLILVSLGTAWGAARPTSNKPFVDPKYPDMFSHYDLGVGGDQHYPDTARRAFVSIVASAVGDLDGDGNQDIVLLADSIPPNGAYAVSPPATYMLNHVYPRDTVYDNSWGSVNNFLRPGDALFGAADIIPGFSNPAITIPTWFKTSPRKDAVNSGPTSYAPPSANIVAGMLYGYTGSDVAWLRGDGRGHFNLFYITPNNSPVTIRGGYTIKLARLQDPNQTGLDIVLTSGNDLVGYRASPGTNIEPFTGTGRVMWLRNLGWEGNVVNSRLNFDQHVVAEYNYDRMPTPFYTGLRIVDGIWVSPSCSLNPYPVEIIDIDNDGRQDLLVGNIPLGNYPFSVSPAIYNGEDLSTDFSDLLPRPKIGELFTRIVDAEFRPTEVAQLVWYKNEPGGGGIPNISTATCKVVKDPGGAVLRLDNPLRVNESIYRMRLAGGREAFLWGDSWTDQTPPQIFLREQAAGFQLIRTATQWGGQWFGGHVRPPKLVDFNGDGIDELYLPVFDCDPGCNFKSEIWSLTPNGNDVSLNRKLRLDHGSDPPPHKPEPDDVELTDVNGDGRIDICLFQGQMFKHSYSHPSPDPMVILLNTSRSQSLDDLSFRVVRQREKHVFRTNLALRPYNSGMATGWTMPRIHEVFTSTGDFNNDGLTDFVRTGPNIPASLFINNSEGKQRVRIQAVASHDTDVHKEWTAFMGGQGVGAGVTADQNPRGEVVPRPVQTIISE